METYLKHYRAKITAQSPIFIGDGSKIGKKEFIYSDRDGKVRVPDMPSFFSFLSGRHMQDAYARYMLEPGNRSLGSWLNSQDVGRSEYQDFISYSMDAGDALLDTGGQGYNKTGSSGKAKEILCFIKDGQGSPYVPGSSIKGMIRTALLAYEISHDEALKAKYKHNIENALRDSRAGRKNLLSRETKELEQEVFHTVERGDADKRNAVCSNMSGMVVSDSDPLDVGCLVLCQKIDYNTKGEEKRLPILREALKPKTEIIFDITIDGKIFPYDAGTILRALDEYKTALDRNFYSAFGRGGHGKGTVWLGGGCGFPSKTVIAAICGVDTTRVTADIFKTTVRDKTHGHAKDVSEYGISPHVCKCTRYKNRLYDMGCGKMEIIG